MRITITRPDSSTRVSTTFVLTLSLTPRKLTAITASMNPIAMSITTPFGSSRPKPAPRFAANAREPCSPT